MLAVSRPTLEPSDEIAAVLRDRLGDAARAWFERSLAQPGTAFARGDFVAAFAGATRRLAKEPQALSAEALDRVRAAGVAAPQVFSVADFARVALLLRTLQALPSAEHVALATELFRKGDSAERVAVLRALALAPEPERFVPLAVEAARTHVVDVFAAIACENPFPARFLPEPNFNQLVVKTLFLELELARVLDWRARANPELRRMARDYAAERSAAGRPVPADIAAITATEEAP